MVLIPTKIKVQLGIEQGTVYNFSPEKGIVNHYFIVLNKNPKKDDEIYLVSFTSNKDDVLRFIEHFDFDRKTYVEIETNECPFLPRESESCINCNKTRRYDLQKLIDLIDGSDGSCYSKISNKLMVRIIEGVKASKMVPEDIKRVLC